MTKLIAGLGILVLLGALGAGISMTKTDVSPTGFVENSGKVIYNTTGTGSSTGGTTSTTAPTDKLNRTSTTLKELSLGDSRQVYVYGVIDESSAPVAAQQILALGKDPRPITILINSPGGSVLDGAAIISAMQAAKGPVNTVCVQICASMAAMIHQYGTKRLMIDRSLVMFHPATGGVEGEVDKIFSRLGALKDYIGEMELNVANRSGISYDSYKSHSGVEWWLSAKNAVANHVADDIVFVRGADSAKLFTNGQNTMKYVNKKLPFYMLPGTSNTKFYWISVEAYNMLYGQGTLDNGR